MLRQPAPKAGRAAAFIKDKRRDRNGRTKTTASSVNRAKTYQLVLFPLNNGATNVYYVLVLSYIATFWQQGAGPEHAVCFGDGHRHAPVRCRHRPHHWCPHGPHQRQVRQVPALHGHRQPHHGSKHSGAVLPHPAHPRQCHGAALRCVRCPVCRVGHRLHLPDQLHPLRPDRADQ